MHAKRRRVAGQAMVEYIVVVTALVTALLVVRVDNNDGRGSVNVVEWLMDVMKGNQQGYAHSISAVQSYGDFPEAEAPFGGASSPNNENPDNPPVTGYPTPAPPGLPATNAVSRASVVRAGGVDIGTINSDGVVFDFDGNRIGETNDDGTIEFDNGDSDVDYDEYYVRTAIIDGDGNSVEPSAVVQGGKVVGFAYESDDGIFVDNPGVSTGTFSKVELEGGARIAEVSDVFEGLAHIGVLYNGLYYSDLTVQRKGYDGTGNEVAHDYEIVWAETRTVDENGDLVEYEGECGAKANDWQSDPAALDNLLNDDSGLDPSGPTITKQAPNIFNPFPAAISTTSISESTISTEQASCGPAQVTTTVITRTAETTTDEFGIETPTYTYSDKELGEPPVVDYDH